VNTIAVLPPSLVLDPLLRNGCWRILVGAHTTQALLATEVKVGKGSWVSKASGVIAGLPVAAECFNFWANKPASLLLLLRVNGVIGAGGGEASRFAQCALMGGTSGFKQLCI